MFLLRACFLLQAFTFAVAWNKEGTLIATGGIDTEGVVRLWDAKNSSLSNTLKVRTSVRMLSIRSCARSCTPRAREVDSSSGLTLLQSHDGRAVAGLPCNVMRLHGHGMHEPECA